METFLGILIPFLGTALGAACVFFMKRSLGDLVQRALAGFAAGVMVAASIWSLLIPAIEQSEGMGKLSFLPAFIGFWVGVLFLLLLDHLIPHLHVGSNQAEGPKSRLGRTTMMVLAVTLHNIPEGMAVGVMYAGFLAGNTQITAASALALSLGIAILSPRLSIAENEEIPQLFRAFAIFRIVFISYFPYIPLAFRLYSASVAGEERVTTRPSLERILLHPLSNRRAKSLLLVALLNRTLMRFRLFIVVDSN